jgi:hypothetical protein
VSASAGCSDAGSSSSGFFCAKLSFGVFGRGRWTNSGSQAGIIKGALLRVFFLFALGGFFFSFASFPLFGGGRASQFRESRTGVGAWR